MKIAIVGAGVSGLYSAWHLSQQHEVTVFEAEDRLGGHADTQVVDDEGVSRSIDTGFIVFNRAHYPLLSEWFETLDVESKPSDMSFGVSDTSSGMEYNASTLGRLYCQRRNLFNPRFHGMVLDIARFYRRAPALLEELDERVTLGEWLRQSDLGEMFASRHMLPMASALWSAPMGDVTDFPMKHLLAFMDNHTMLTLGERPAWETVRGGSRRYVEAARACPARFVTGTPVRSVERHDGGVRVCTPNEDACFDAAVMACHADQALRLLEDASPVERCVLSAVDYQPNEAVLHTDVSVLPANPAARAAWNVRVDGQERKSMPCFLLHESASGHRQPAAFHRLAQSVRNDRSRAGSRAAQLCPPGIHAGGCGRPVALGRYQRPAAHLVLRRLVGLGLPRGRCAQCPTCH